MWLVDREKKAVNKYSFHGGGSSALQTPFSKGRICWSTFALQYSLLYTASKIFSSLTIRGKTKNSILFCWKARERDRTRQFLWLHIIVLCCAIRRLFRPRKLSLFDGKTIDDDYFATFDQRQKKTDSIIFTKKKKYYTQQHAVKVKCCCLTGRFCESIYLAQSKNHDARTNIAFFFDIVQASFMLHFKKMKKIEFCKNLHNT